MGKGDSSSTSLAPGFRFHPTDEELVSYYLKRKVVGKTFRFDAIAEIDVYKVEPWDLPGLSKLKSRDLEWYFFSSLDKKYGNGSRTNRATGEGYWKTTGKDRPVHHRSKVVGMKKTLVYHQGRAPRGQRTNWVMHEYKLVDEQLEKAGLPLDGIVLCRIFQKSGTGPKNGEQYGAPFAEEEWEKEEVEVAVPGEVLFEEPFADEEAYIEQNDFDQSLDWQLPAIVPVPVPVPVPDSIQYEDNNVHAGDSRELVASEAYVGAQRECTGELRVLDDQFFDLPVQATNNTTDIVRNEHMVQLPNNESSGNYLPNEPSANCQLPNEPLKDTAWNDLLDDGTYLDAIDFGLDPTVEDPFAFDFGNSELFPDTDLDFMEYLNNSPSLLSDDTDQSLSSEEKPEVPSPTPGQQLLGAQNGDVGSSSKQAVEFSKSVLPKTAIDYSYLSYASRLLDIPGAPVNALEVPSKDITARLTAAVHQASSSVHVTAGMVRIQDMTTGHSGLQWSLDKTGNVNVLLSFDLPENVGHTGLGLGSGLGSFISSKVSAALSRGFMRSVLGVLVFAVSLKIGSLIYAE